VGGVGAPLFLVDTLPAGERVTLSGPEGHHAATVQRLRVGEELVVGDGRGALATGVITGVGRSTLELRVTDRRYEQPQLPRLVVVQAIAKGDRGELAVQAMTEAGVDEVVPWPAARAVAKWRGERGEHAWQRWVLTAREAAKQARRPWLPAVAAAAPTPAVASRLSTAAAGFVLHEEATARLTEVELPGSGDIVLVIGPEGGISPKELAEFEAAGAVPVRLGSAVLRTSTAGVAALSVLSARLGRW
jgi:16S rRNA (uracil1498-N3)-methyltransferase